MNSPTRPDSTLRWSTASDDSGRLPELGCRLRSQGVLEKHARTTHGTETLRPSSGPLTSGPFPDG